MPVRFNVGGGGGVTSEDVTATKAYVHPSYKTITKDSNDEVVAGTMPLLAAKTYTCLLYTSSQLNIFGRILIRRLQIKKQIWTITQTIMVYFTEMCCQQKLQR